MIFIITLLTYVGLAIAKLFGFVTAPWFYVHSMVFVIPLLYLSLCVLMGGAEELWHYMQEEDEDEQ